MKNIHILPTDKESRLWTNNLKRRLVLDEFPFHHPTNIAKNIYITSDEEIKEGDWCYDKVLNLIFQTDNHTDFKYANQTDNVLKIILTTDQDLIKDGVQPIDDEFLEWFVKNPSCEWVEVKEKQHFEADKSKRINPLNGVYYSYKIIIPQEEPKQETLEEAAERYAHNYFNMHETNNYKALKQGYEAGAKEMAERMYSDEEVKEALLQMRKTPMTFVPDKRMYSEEQLFKILLDFVEFPHDHNEGRGSIINRFLKELKKK